MIVYVVLMELINMCVCVCVCVCVFRIAVRCYVAY